MAPAPEPGVRRFAALVAVVVLAGCGGSSGSDDGVASIELEQRDGGSVTLGDYEGTPLLVNVFAAWCRPCEEEMPALERVRHRLDGQLTVLGVSIDPKPADGWRLVGRTGVTYDVAHTEGPDLLRALGAVGMPTTALLDADGRVLDVRTGAATEDEIVEWVQDLLPAGS